MKDIIFYFIIAILAIGLGYHFIKGPEIIETETTKVVQDTTVVDSLKTVIEYWQDIAENERDTIEVKVEVPVPSPLDDDINRYRIPYSDNTLSALVGLDVEGKIVSEMDFSYSLKREFVREIDNRIYTTRYVETERTITRTIQPSAYMSLGLGVFATADDIFAVPTLTYTSAGRSQYSIGYDVINHGVYVGVSVPISFRSILPFNI